MTFDPVCLVVFAVTRVTAVTEVTMTPLANVIFADDANEVISG